MATALSVCVCTSVCMCVWGWHHAVQPRRSPVALLYFTLVSPDPCRCCSRIQGFSSCCVGVELHCRERERGIEGGRQKGDREAERSAFQCTTEIHYHRGRRSERGGEEALSRFASETDASSSQVTIACMCIPLYTFVSASARVRTYAWVCRGQWASGFGNRICRAFLFYDFLTDWY